MSDMNEEGYIPDMGDERLMVASPGERRRCTLADLRLYAEAIDLELCPKGTAAAVHRAAAVTRESLAVFQQGIIDVAQLQDNLRNTQELANVQLMELRRLRDENETLRASIIGTALKGGTLQ